MVTCGLYPKPKALYQYYGSIIQELKFLNGSPGKGRFRVSFKAFSGRVMMPAAKGSLKRHASPHLGCCQKN